MDGEGTNQDEKKDTGNPDLTPGTFLAVIVTAIFLALYFSFTGHKNAPASQKDESAPETAEKGMELGNGLDEPEIIVESFYNWYLANDPDAAAAASREELDFTDARINKNTAGGYLCNRYSSRPASVQANSSGNAEEKSFRLELNVNYCWGTDIIPVEMVRKNDGWKIGNIACDSLIRQANAISRTTDPELAGKAPEFVAESFYKWYLLDSGGQPNLRMQDCSYRQRTELTPELRKKLDIFSPVDPLICTNETLTEMTFDKAVIAGETATVRMVEKTNTGTNYVPLKMEYENGQWRIAGVTCAKDKGLGG